MKIVPLPSFSFQKWSDKEEILRKSKILKNSGIWVEEDFSKAAKNRRRVLAFRFQKDLQRFVRVFFFSAVLLLHSSYSIEGGVFLSFAGGNWKSW